MQVPIQHRPVHIELDNAPLVTSARLFYDPKHQRTKFKPWYCIARVDTGLVRYYQWWIWHLYRVKLTDSAWKPHCTVTRGENPRGRKMLWKKYDRFPVDLHYSPEVWTNGKHWWLPVASPELEKIRKELGLRPRPYVPFHITIGHQVY